MSDGNESEPVFKDLSEYPTDTNLNIVENFKMEILEDATPDTFVGAAVLRIEELINERGWAENDPNPIVGVIQGSEVGIGFAEQPLPNVRGVVFTDWFEALISLFAEKLAANWGDPGDPLPGILGHMQREMATPGLKGALLSTEGWTVDPPGADAAPEVRAAWEDARANNTFHAHPDRKEVRTTMVMLLSKDIIFITRVRGHEPKVDIIKHRGSSDVKVGGRLPLLLESYLGLILALLAQQNYQSAAVNDIWFRDVEEATE